MVTVSFQNGNSVGPGGKRGRIVGFSEESRLRMLKFMHTIEFSEGVLITLTYGNKWQEESLETKKHLQAWRRYFEKKYGKLPMIWKLELQLRGAPHYHIYVMKKVFVDIPDAGKAWHKIVGSKQDVHEKIGVDVKSVGVGSGVRQVGKYIGKYVSKLVTKEEEDEIKYRGRYWGHWNVEQAEPKECRLVDERNDEFLTGQFVENKVKVEKWMTTRLYGYTLFTGDVGTGNSRDKTIDIITKLC
jgi:hypothetical protein